MTVQRADVATGDDVVTTTIRIPDADKGMLNSIKNLYQGPKDDDGKRNWVEEMPELDPPVETEATAQHALLVRNAKSYGGRKKFDIESIVIQSPLLRKTLGAILDDYPGIATDLDKLTFEPSFEPFVHRWSLLRNVLSGLPQGPERDHLSLLHDVLEEELRDTIAARDDFLKHGFIDFPSLWMLFEPGSLIYSSKYGQPCAARFQSGCYDENRCGKFFGLSCQSVEWDGERFGYAETDFKIPEFAGTVKISDLNAMPIQNCGNYDVIKEDLIRRGRVWESLSGHHYMFYQGYAIEQTRDGPQACTVDSRIIIDTYGWNKFEPGYMVRTSAFKDSEIESSDVSDDGSCDARSEESYVRVLLNDISKESKGTRKFRLSDQQCLLASPSLRGYSLSDKKWLTFFLKDIKPNTFSTTAFSSLVLDEQQKDLVLALTTAQRKHEHTFDDVVAGKGRGMIMLLSGPPGVGKTLTAESVAEVLEVPLYVVGAEDLGDQGRHVERNLRKILEMCARWKAVCLIDEADVFLEARNVNDLQRNKLVSIFLRTLEYYEGILFLTTNRMDNIDAAFQSRIHLSLSYPDLDPTSRRQVWQQFIKSASKTSRKRKDEGESSASIASSEFSEEDLDRLSKFKMNGREIKNVLKTAQLLATMKEQVLRFDHVKTVMVVEQRYQGKF